MHVLVTGGGGFLGRAIVNQLLARGDRVRSFSRGEYPDLTELGVETVRGDIRNSSEITTACRGVDAVIHTAAIAGIGGPWQKFFAANTLGTRHVIAACRKLGIGRLVYTSSPSVTFAGRDQEGVNEAEAVPDLEWLARNGCHYSRSKALAEAEVLAANDPTLATCALRPHLIWGPGDPHLIPRLIARARSGRLRRVGEGGNLVDIIYVENAAYAHLQALDSLGPPAEAGSPKGSPGAPASPLQRAGGRAYFLSQGEPVNCWHWINQILAQANLPPVEKSISLKTALRVGGILERLYTLVGTEREPPMTRFLAWQLSSSHWFDISAAREHFGYQPQISTAQGMKQLAEWLRTARLA